MKKLSKMICVLMACLMLFSTLTSCGKSKESGITVSALEEEFTDGTWKFSITNTGKESSFSYFETSSVYKVFYSGKAKNNNVYSVTIRNDNVTLISSLQNENILKQILIKPAMDRTINELRISKCFLTAWGLEVILLGRSSSLTSSCIKEATDLFNGLSITENNWTISASIEESTVTIHAEYDN